MEYFIGAFKKYATFTGRARRKEYWTYTLFYFLIGIIVSILQSLLNLGSVLTIIYAIVCFIPTLAITARRLHDIGKSGWWMLIGLIPIIGTIISLVWFFTDSGPDNQYGPTPKGVQSVAPAPTPTI